MTVGKARLGLALTVPLLVAGCTGSVHGGSPGPATTTVAASAIVGASDEGSPSVKTEMVCGKETMGNVTTLVGAATLPAAKTTWVDHLYTCTYQLPQGPLVISVKESSDPNTAQAYFETLKRGAGTVTPLAILEALGLPSFHTTTGQAAFVKDSLTLKVDATRLPAQVGQAATGRASFADAVANDILVCWQEQG